VTPAAEPRAQTAALTPADLASGTPTAVGQAPAGRASIGPSVAGDRSKSAVSYPATAGPRGAAGSGAGASEGLVAPGLRATIASEWTKLVSLRSTVVTVILALVLSLAMTALVSTLVGASWDSWDQAGREEFDPVLFPLLGGIFAGVMMAVLAVKVVTAEYSSGMMRLTLTATPRRGRLLLAKAVVVTALNLAVGTVVTLGAFTVGQVIFAAYGLDTAGIGETDTMRALLGLSLVSPVFPLIGMVLGVLTRSTAGAVTAVLGLIFAPTIVGAMLPAWWQRNVISLLPGPASDSISISHLDDSTDYLDPLVAVVVVVAWLALGLALARLTLTRRDA
jgi:ABC-2 type transport system permease protein